MSEKLIKKWWEETSKHYQKEAKINTHSAHYGPYAPDENELRLLGNLRGKRILELGCGGGQCSIAFAKKGAKVTGIDISEKQLEYAKELAKKNKVNVKFIRKSFQNLKGLKKRNYDIVFSAYAFQYSPNFKKILKQIYKLLKKRGLLVFSFDHPFYSLINRKNYKIKKRYNDFKWVEKETWPDGSKHTFIAYYRTISTIFNLLIDSGFSVEKILEPLKLKNQTAWTQGVWKDIYPKKLVKLIAPTLIFLARK